MRFFALLLLPLCGCSIQKFNRPPQWGSVVASHVRFYGLDATIPTGSGVSIGVKLGWGSSTWTVIPVSTNSVFIPKISDTFGIFQSLNPLDTTIREYLQTGWEGPTPTPATQIFSKPPSVTAP